MTDHPITPPIELVQQWMTEARSQDYVCITEQVAHRAAQWGADQELEAIIRLAGQAALPEKDRYFDGLTVAAIRSARRPKPPSLKEQALAELTAWTEMRNGPGESLLCDGLSVATIRRALEALPDD